MTAQEQTDLEILKCLPGTPREISAKCGVSRSYINKRLKSLVGADKIKVIDSYPVKNQTAYIWGLTSMEAKKKIAPPESKYKTIWQGGAHPCEQFNPFARIAA